MKIPALIVGAGLLLMGCQARQLSPDQIAAMGEGLASSISRSDAYVTSGAEGLPNEHVVYGDDGVALERLTSQLPMTAIGFSEGDLVANSPKDTAFERLEVLYGADGKPASIVIEGFTTNVSSALEADAQTVSLLVDYVKGLPEAQRAALVDSIPGLAQLLGGL